VHQKDEDERDICDVDKKVVDLGEYRKSRDRADYYNIILISRDGSFIFNPDNYILIELTHMDQVDAIVDGNIEKAIEVGAEAIPISSLAHLILKENKK